MQRMSGIAEPDDRNAEIRVSGVYCTAEERDASIIGVMRTSRQNVR